MAIKYKKPNNILLAKLYMLKRTIYSLLPKPNLASPFNNLFIGNPQDFFNKALLASILLHGLILTLKLTQTILPTTKNIDSPLEVSLVNSRTDDAPDKADILAQHNLKGGGEYDKHAFTSPLPAINNGDGELIKLLKKQEDASETQQKQLVATQSEFSISQNNQAASNKIQNSQQGRDSQTINQEIAKLEAEINREIQQMAKRPKRSTITAASAKSVVYAKYYDNIRSSIEDYGTTYFPKDEKGNPIYGDLILVIRINKEGSLGYNKDQYYAASVEVARSSGNPLLDKRAIEIVKACAPFGSFSKEMAKSIDILEVISTFKFNKQGFATTLQNK